MDVTYNALDFAMQFSLVLVATLTLVVAIVVAVTKRR